MKRDERTEAGNALSWGRSMLIFLAALLLFAALRWQPDQWLATRIDQLARTHGIALNYAEIEAGWMGVTVRDLTVQRSGMARAVKLQALQLSPAWGALAGGEVGIHIVLPGAQPHGSLDLFADDSEIAVKSIDLQLNAVDLQSLPGWKVSLPAETGGRLALSGTLLLDAATGQPLDGHLTLNWQDASVNLPGIAKPLGDYRLQLQRDSAAEGQWQWQLAGGRLLIVEGSGAVTANAAPLPQWPVAGRIQLRADNRAGALSALLGGAQQVFAIAGRLAAPRLTPVVLPQQP